MTDHAPEALDSPATAPRGSVQRIVRGHQSATLYLGDCLDMLPIEADAVISDPPYGMDWPCDMTSMAKRGPKYGGRDWGQKVAGDGECFDPEPWFQYERVVLFGFNHFAARVPVGTTLVWIKVYDEGYGKFFSDAELAWMKGGVGVYCKRDTSMKGINGERVHPTQKPVAVMAWCMDRAKVPEGATVLDPYMGSGTTGIACLRTNRNFIGIEKDPHHFAIAVERIEREARQGMLF